MARKMATFVAALLMSGGAATGMQAWAQTNDQNDGSDNSKSSQASQAQSVPYGFAGGYQETDKDKLGFPDRPNRQRMRAAGSRYRESWRDDSGQNQGQSSAGRRSSDDWADRDVWDDRYSLYDRNTSGSQSRGSRNDWSDRRDNDDRSADDSRSWSSQQGSSSQQGRRTSSTDRARLTSALRRAGFTDIRVLDAAYLVRARTQDGDTILMYINPPTRSSSSNASQDHQSSSSSRQTPSSGTPSWRAPSWQRDRDAPWSQNND